MHGWVLKYHFYVSVITSILSIVNGKVTKQWYVSLYSYIQLYKSVGKRLLKSQTYLSGVCEGEILRQSASTVRTAPHLCYSRKYRSPGLHIVDFTLLTLQLQQAALRSLSLTWFNFNSSMLSKMQDEITYPFPNFSEYPFEVWEWMSNLIPLYIMGVVTYPGWDKSKYMFPDSKFHVANMGPTWVLSAPGEPHVGHKSLAIRVCKRVCWKANITMKVIPYHFFVLSRYVESSSSIFNCRHLPVRPFFTVTKFIFLTLW